MKKAERESFNRNFNNRQPWLRVMAGGDNHCIVDFFNLLLRLAFHHPLQMLLVKNRVVQHLHIFNPSVEPYILSQSKRVTEILQVQKKFVMARKPPHIPAFLPTKWEISEPHDFSRRNQPQRGVDAAMNLQELVFSQRVFFLDFRVI